uniref:Ribonuclease H-like domain-containing protein n=1 Tax=Tanacetum cinerariifolium TaxID=118510 RepID=A0A6L2J4F4_TANCI|nr:ribonuclease H-like domain-containing protein [Tanacetum cinerariifolium]
MAALRYKDEHNKVGYLIKPIGSDDYHHIIDFLRTSHIRAPKPGSPVILATIDKTPYTITEDLRFLVHTFLHCLSTKSGSWDQFGSPNAIAFIFLSDGRHFNWSNYFFRGMVSNIGNAKKFLMYLRFLQTILAIETRVTRQYKVLVFSSKLFANMRLNFGGQPMPLLLVMLVQAQVGEGAEVAAQAVPQPMPAPDQPPAHLSPPSTQQTFDPIAPVLEHGQSSDPHTASFSQSHESDAGPFTTVEDLPLGGNFHTSPPRSSQPPLASQPSGGAKDPITLTALSFVVSTLMQKVHSLETELQDHKKLFKDVVGKLVKKVKALKVKLKTKKRKMVVTDSDQEVDGQQDMDLDALRALANAAVTVDSDIPSGSTLQIPTASLSIPTACPSGALTVLPGTSDVLPGTFDVLFGTSDVLHGTFDVPSGTFIVPTGASTVLAGSLNVPTDVSSSAAPAGVLSKGKSLMMEEDILVKARTFKQIEEDRLGEEADKRLHDEEIVQLERQRAEERQNRPMSQAKQKAYMRQYVKNQSSVVYNTGWTMAYVKSFTDDQLKQEFEKIRKVQSNGQIQAFSKTLKPPGPMLEEPSSKRQQSTEAPIPPVHEVPLLTAVSSPLSFRTRRKSLGQKHILKPKSTLPKLDLAADAQTFIKVVVNEDSDDEATPNWSAVVCWEVLPTPLGEINALYRIDGSTKHFTTLR